MINLVINKKYIYIMEYTENKKRGDKRDDKQEFRLKQNKLYGRHK